MLPYYYYYSFFFLIALVKYKKANTHFSLMHARHKKNTNFAKKKFPVKFSFFFCKQTYIFFIKRKNVLCKKKKNWNYTWKILSFIGNFQSWYEAKGVLLETLWLTVLKSITNYIRNLYTCNWKTFWHYLAPTYPNASSIYSHPKDLSTSFTTPGTWKGHSGLTFQIDSMSEREKEGQHVWNPFSLNVNCCTLPYYSFSTFLEKLLKLLYFRWNWFFSGNFPYKELWKIY